MGKLRKIGKSWQIDYLDPNGVRVRKNFKDRKLAEAELAKRISLIAEGRYLDIKKDLRTTLGELIEKYEENYGEQSSYKSSKRFFIESFKEYFGCTRILGTIRYVDIESYRNYLRKKPTHHTRKRTDATVNREMSCLRHMMRKAMEWEMAESSPFEKGRSLMLKENNARLRFLNEDEIGRLLAAASDYLRDIIVCVLNTGMRRGEVLGLKWNQIRLEFIYLSKTKTNESRQIPINESLGGLFKRIREQQSPKSEYVFTYQGEPIKDVKVGFNAATKKAGIIDFHFHDLRHTFASQMIMRGAGLKDVQEILGHKSLAMTLRYAHLSQEHKRKAINLLNGII